MPRRRDNVVPFRKPFRAVPLGRVAGRYRERETTWTQAFVAVRPWLLLIALATCWSIYMTPGFGEPPAFMQSTPERIDGRFTRCGAGRGYYCVVDGDTFRIGQRAIRVVGIDTAEVAALCPAEAAQAAASTQALQDWLNEGAFTMTARLDEPTDRYGRELRMVRRVFPDGRVERLADHMRADGGARGYYGGGRGGWC